MHRSFPYILSYIRPSNFSSFLSYLLFRIWKNKILSCSQSTILIISFLSEKNLIQYLSSLNWTEGSQSNWWKGDHTCFWWRCYFFCIGKTWPVLKCGTVSIDQTTGKIFMLLISYAFLVGENANGITVKIICIM